MARAEKFVIDPYLLSRLGGGREGEVFVLTKRFGAVKINSSLRKLDKRGGIIKISAK